MNLQADPAADVADQVKILAAMSMALIAIGLGGLPNVKSAMYSRKAACLSAGVAQPEPPMFLWVSIGMWMAGLVANAVILVLVMYRPRKSVVRGSMFGNCCSVCIFVLCGVFWFFFL